MNSIWSVGETLEQAEKSIIEAALRFYNGNKTMTAASLGVSARGLDGKLERFNIDRKKVIEDENAKTDKLESKDRSSDKKKNRGRPKKVTL